MAITASLVKELRERTGAGMMECKKALVAAEGSIETAIEEMRKSGMAKADKKAGRTAAEGLLGIKISDDNKTAVIVEINCETDFVTKSEDFTNFVDVVTSRVLEKQPADVDALLSMSISESDDTSVEDSRKELIAKIGENTSIRRFEIVKSTQLVASYKHGDRIGVLVNLEGGNEALGRDIAMHIAASKPECISEENVSNELIEKEKEIFTAQALESGKPAEIVEKMIGGRIKKYLKEITLLGQPFVKNPDQSIEQLLKASNAEVKSFIRFEVGEGIEKKQENFADEVMAQVKGQ